MKNKVPDYINKKLKHVSKKDLLAAIQKVEIINEKIDKKSRFTHADLLVTCNV